MGNGKIHHPLVRLRRASLETQSSLRIIFGRGSCFTGHAGSTVNSLGLIRHRHAQTQMKGILNRIYPSEMVASSEFHGASRISWIR